MTIEDLRPGIEAVYHACCAGKYDWAFDLYWRRVLLGESRVLVYDLGAWETNLSLLLGFFPDRNISREPAVANPDAARAILNDTGLTLMNLGRLKESLTPYQRSLERSIDDHTNAGFTEINIAELHVYLGNISEAMGAAARARSLAARSSNVLLSVNSLTKMAWIADIAGNYNFSLELYEQANVILLRNSVVPLGYDVSGADYIDFLRRIGQHERARGMLKRAIELSSAAGVRQALSKCYRVNGDLDADEGDDVAALRDYDQAIVLAGNHSLEAAIIEALSARGRVRTRLGDFVGGEMDLLESLARATRNGYRLYEADARLGLVRVYLVRGQIIDAREHARLALHLVTACGYGRARREAESLAQLSSGIPGRAEAINLHAPQLSGNIQGGGG